MYKFCPSRIPPAVFLSQDSGKFLAENLQDGRLIFPGSSLHLKLLTRPILPDSHCLTTDSL